MFAPDSTTHQLPHLIQHERLSHSALLQKVARERSTDSIIVDRQAQRRLTSRRLAATVAGTLLGFSFGR